MDRRPARQSRGCRARRFCCNSNGRLGLTMNRTRVKHKKCVAFCRAAIANGAGVELRRSVALLPLPRIRGRGRGGRCGARRNFPIRPSPQPSPLITGARGPDSPQMEVTPERRMHARGLAMWNRTGKTMGKRGAKPRSGKSTGEERGVAENVPSTHRRATGLRRRT